MRRRRRGNEATKRQGAEEQSTCHRSSYVVAPHFYTGTSLFELPGRAWQYAVGSSCQLCSGQQDVNHAGPRRDSTASQRP